MSPGLVNDSTGHQSFQTFSSQTILPQTVPTRTFPSWKITPWTIPAQIIQPQTIPAQTILSRKINSNLECFIPDSSTLDSSAQDSFIWTIPHWTNITLSGKDNYTLNNCFLYSFVSGHVRTIPIQTITPFITSNLSILNYPTL